MSDSFSNTKHPILDRTELFRARVDRLQLGCLDTVWRGQHTRRRFFCAKGHLIFKSPAQVRDCEDPCRECSQDRLTEELRTAARSAGVVWLNERWLGARRNHEFCCNAGHRWQRQGSKALVRCGCPFCTRVQSSQLNGLQRLRKAAAQHGGKCLATSFESNHHRYLFSCAAGHGFELLGSSAMSGSWCRECANVRQVNARISELNRVCAARGGACVSDAFLGSRKQHRFRCRAGHEWLALPATILRGSWCRRCESAKSKSLEAAHEQAMYYGGRCLSQTYSGVEDKLQWTCGFGHVWSDTLARVRCGNWCRECRKTPKSMLKRLARHRALHEGER
ncbi:MAG: hypothetical protein JWP80_2962 [Pseudomonas sp.]|nr:hypothetical protein [Pseudomonas sp.]